MKRELDFQTVFLNGNAGGYGLATIKVLYRMPDEALLRSFTWQFYDVAPDHPRLFKFLDFWAAEIVGRIHSVEVAHQQLVSAGEIRHACLHRSFH